MHQETLDIKTDLVQKDIERLSTEGREVKAVCDQLQDLYQQRDTILSKCGSECWSFVTAIFFVQTKYLMAATATSEKCNSKRK